MPTVTVLFRTGVMRGRVLSGADGVGDDAAVCGDLIAVRVREFLSDAVRAEEARLATERLQNRRRASALVGGVAEKSSDCRSPERASVVARTFLQRRGSAVHAGQNGTVAIERLLGDTSARRCKSAIRRAVVATSLGLCRYRFYAGRHGTAQRLRRFRAQHGSHSASTQRQSGQRHQSLGRRRFPFVGTRHSRTPPA